MLSKMVDVKACSKINVSFILLLKYFNVYSLKRCLNKTNCNYLYLSSVVFLFLIIKTYGMQLQ